MKIEFTIKNLNCPNCMREIEKTLNQIDYISDAKIDLFDEKMTLQIDPLHKDDIFDTARRIIREQEPSADLMRCASDSDDRSDDAGYGRTVLGGLVAVLGMVFFYSGVIPQHVSVIIILCAYFILGFEVLWSAFCNILRGHIFDENFLMAIASVGAIGIGEYPEAAAVMLFYQIGEIFENRAVRASRRNIRSLMDIMPDTAHVIRGGDILDVKSADVGKGETISIRPGERIPLDGIVLKGSSMLDMKALTGESVPQHVGAGDTVLSGAVNTMQVLTVKTTHLYSESTASKIISMVQSARTRKAKAENFITGFAKYYTPAVVILAALLALIPPLFFSGTWSEWLNRGFIFLVISCPCALVISVPITFFSGIGIASRNGILVKGGNYLEALTQLKTVVFDKTGTLTHGTFEVTSVRPASGISNDELLRAAACAEAMSNHPISQSIMAEIRRHGITPDESGTYTELGGRGIRCEVNGTSVFAGNARLMREMSITFDEADENGTVVYIARGSRYLGYFIIADTLKKEAGEAIRRMRACGIQKTVMLTGDTPQTAGTIAEYLKLDEYHAGLLPADKVNEFEKIAAKTNSKGKIAFIGDGINDAPVLARADIGFAMGGIGSDAAVEAADIVLVSDELTKIPMAVDIAVHTHRIVWQNIIFALGIKALILILGSLGMVNMWAAVFADVGVMVICVLNAMRLLRYKPGKSDTENSDTPDMTNALEMS